MMTTTSISMEVDKISWKELFEWFKSLGCDEEDARKLADKVKVQGYELVVNPEKAEVGRGSQYFGSGGYWHDYAIWLPKNYEYIEDLEKTEIIEVIEKREYDNGFVSGVWYTIKPKVRPLIISHSRGDEIGGRRIFNMEIFVWY